MMPSIVAFLLLCILVTCGRAEGHPQAHLQIKRATFSSKPGGDFHLSPKNVASAHSVRSPAERLTVMDFSVPELSATSFEGNSGGGMDGAEAPTASLQPTSFEEPGASVAPTSFPSIPTRTPEPTAGSTSHTDFGAQDDSSDFSPQASAPESREPPRIQFRRFNSDGSLAAVFATPTKSPEPTSDPLGNFFESVSENSPSKSAEPELDNVPEATEDSDDDVEGAASTNTQEEETFIGPMPELSPLVTPSPEIFEEDEELVEDDKNVIGNGTNNSDKPKPRQSVFVSGPVTASVTWNKGDPPVFSFASSENNESVVENSDEGTPVSEDAEASGDDLLEASSEPELDTEDGGDTAIGRLQPKSPGRPKPINSESSTEAFIMPTHAPGTGATSPLSESTNGNPITQEQTRPLDTTGLETISSSPKPSNVEGKEQSVSSIGDGVEESSADASPLEVLSGVSGTIGTSADIMDEIEPGFSAEPEASAEIPMPSEEPELLTVTIIVRHPPSFGAQELAEEIRLNSNEFVTPDEWEIVTLFQISQLSKFAAVDVDNTSVLKDASEDGLISFELLLETQCTADAECQPKLQKYKEFVRDGRMDETLAAHDFSRVSVFLEGEMTERSKPLAAIGTSGLGVGVIAGIAVGGVALMSLVVLVAVVAANMRNGSTRNHSSNYDSDLEFEDDVGPGNELPLDQGSFMISNFGGTPRNSTAMIPWLNDSSAGSGMEYSSQSFISVDSMAPGDANRMSQYRFEETKSSASGSEIDEEVSQVVGPQESGSTVYAVQ